ncbi:acetyltransferase [Candidatus Stoquefichus sp. SB1]|uniref:acetyltransferase n=1 Tax=Candidatus Stoquefichus sp. SB1 TaxID=1658109 RepID=UPI00067E9DFF|nr:acetyltransferase [Candidatus Stoquefichus sp. SB1]
MKDIYIIGASGFGREVAWLIEELNEWNIAGFIDDNEEIQNTLINDIPVAGGISFLSGVDKEINVVIAIGNPVIREKIVSILESNPNIIFPNIIAKGVRISKYIQLGHGNIICTGAVLTTNIKIGNFNHINLSCTVGHDAELKNYITVYPSVNVSGNVTIGNSCEIGTGTKIIQGKHIGENIILGAGSVVIKDIAECGTYVGSPARKVIR